MSECRIAKNDSISAAPAHGAPFVAAVTTTVPATIATETIFAVRAAHTPSAHHAATAASVSKSTSGSGIVVWFGWHSVSMSYTSIQRFSASAIPNCGALTHGFATVRSARIRKVSGPDAPADFAASGAAGVCAQADSNSKPATARPLTTRTYRAGRPKSRSAEAATLARMPLRDRHRRAISAAAAHRRDGESHEAIQILADVLTSEPGHVTANAEMARALRLIGDAAGAEEHLRICLRDVLDYQLLVELASVLAEQDRVAEAEETLDGALFMAEKMPRLDPGEALLVRAAIAAGDGRPDAARAALDAIPPKRASATVKRYAERLRASLADAPRTSDETPRA
jgi:hypothetical protein